MCTFRLWVSARISQRPTSISSLLRLSPIQVLKSSFATVLSFSALLLISLWYELLSTLFLKLMLCSIRRSTFVIKHYRASTSQLLRFGSSELYKALGLSLDGATTQPTESSQISHQSIETGDLGLSSS